MLCKIGTGSSEKILNISLKEEYGERLFTCEGAKEFLVNVHRLLELPDQPIGHYNFTKKK